MNPVYIELIAVVIAIGYTVYRFMTRSETHVPKPEADKTAADKLLDTADGIVSQMATAVDNTIHFVTHDIVEFFGGEGYHTLKHHSQLFQSILDHRSKGHLSSDTQFQSYWNNIFTTSDNIYAIVSWGMPEILCLKKQATSYNAAYNNDESKNKILDYSSEEIAYFSRELSVVEKRPGSPYQKREGLILEKYFNPNNYLLNYLRSNLSTLDDPPYFNKWFDEKTPLHPHYTLDYNDNLALFNKYDKISKAVLFQYQDFTFDIDYKFLGQLDPLAVYKPYPTKVHAFPYINWIYTNSAGKDIKIYFSTVAPGHTYLYTYFIYVDYNNDKIKRMFPFRFIDLPEQIQIAIGACCTFGNYQKAYAGFKWLHDLDGVYWKERI